MFWFTQKNESKHSRHPITGMTQRAEQMTRIYTAYIDEFIIVLLLLYTRMYIQASVKLFELFELKFDLRTSHKMFDNYREQSILCQCLYILLRVQDVRFLFVLRIWIVSFKVKLGNFPPG